MPELLEYTPDKMLDLSNDERQHRAGWIAAGWQYYDGNMRKPLKVKPGQPDDNVLVNLVAKMVDQAVELLFGEMPEFQLDAEDERSPAELALDALWEANRGQIFLNNLATSGALAGHCYVKLLPTEDETRLVRFVALKPEQVTVFWQPDDLERVTAYMIYWSRGDEEYREDHVNMETSWQVINMMRSGGGRGWQITNQQTWPYPWAQIVDWQNLPDPRDYYGQPDLQNAALNDAENFVLSNTQRIIRYHAHPRTIGTGFRAGDLTDTSVESFWTIPSVDAKVTNLEMQSDLASSATFARALQEQFWSEHRGFDMTTVKDKLGQGLTNFGLRVMMGDALAKASTKRQLYGMGLQAVNRRVMEMLGYGPDNVTKIIWQDMLPSNTVEAAQVQQLLLGMGVTSKASAATALGLDWEQEQERMADESAGEDDIGARLLRAFEQGA